MKKDLILISRMSPHLKGIYNALRCSNINVVHAENTYEAKAGLEIHSPAFVLLDFDIKGADFLLDEIAFGQHIPQPYIMISAAYADGNDRAAMLKRGADYCVDKPINASRKTVTMRGEPVLLTRKEYEVLCFLATHAGIILTKEDIYRAVWKTEYDPKGTNVSDQISSLRSKLGLSCKDDTYIRTVIGVGYRFGDIE